MPHICDHTTDDSPESGKQSNVQRLLPRQRLIPLLCLSASVLTAGTGCRSNNAVAENKPPATDPVPTPVKPAPNTPLNVESAQLHGPTWDKQWDVFIERSLPPEMLGREVPHDVRRWCPAFYTMGETDKRAWWAYLFQAVAAAEAGLNATSNVRHTEPAVAIKDSVTGQITHQQGLLQLTYRDSTRYGCDFDWKADQKLPPHDPNRTILNPERNLACGIRILDHQIIEQHKPIYTRTSYWATLQPGTMSFRVFEKQMTNPPAACGYHPTTPHEKQKKAAAQREIAQR
jgi:hypothetical protein